MSIQAREIAAAVTSVRATTERARGLQSVVSGSDGHLAVESPVALALDVVCEALVARTVRAYFGKAPQAPAITLLEERRMLHAGLTTRSPLLLVDDTTWDEAVDRALDEAAGTLEACYGKDPASWHWGSAHAIHWRHNLGRDGELAAVLNLPPMPVGGDGNTPFNTYAERDGKVAVGVSYRQIFDLADLNGARICIPPGNSGQPGSPHYADNIDRWREVEYHPLYINWDDIEANAEARLVLSAAPR